jgi:hypothetical protein
MVDPLPAIPRDLFVFEVPFWTFVTSIASAVCTTIKVHIICFADFRFPFWAVPESMPLRSLGFLSGPSSPRRVTIRAHTFERLPWPRRVSQGRRVESNSLLTPEHFRVPLTRGLWVSRWSRMLFDSHDCQTHGCFAGDYGPAH